MATTGSPNAIPETDGNRPWRGSSPSGNGIGDYSRDCFLRSGCQSWCSSLGPCSYGYLKAGKGGSIHGFGDAAFFCSVQLLTISSSMTNPLTPVGKVVDVGLRTIIQAGDGGGWLFQPRWQEGNATRGPDRGRMPG